MDLYDERGIKLNMLHFTFYRPPNWHINDETLINVAISYSVWHVDHIIELHFG